MQAYQVIPGQKIESLELVNLPNVDVLSATQVRIKVHAVSLNYRDLMVADGVLGNSDNPVIAASDFAGEIIEVGHALQTFKVGDRVMASFYLDWLDGNIHFQKVNRTFGADSDGVLCEEIVLDQSCLVKIPEHLSYVQASTLPCAAVTAWNALFGAKRLYPGATVLLLGTGGVSMMALQMAKASGFKVIITSSKDEKLSKAKALGADHGINYLSTPDWETSVMELTHGEGVDWVLEVGGKDTLSKSLGVLGAGGEVAIIGGISSFDVSFSLFSLLYGARQMRGIFVGSRQTLEDLCQWISVSKMVPLVDRVFKFNQSQDAFRYLASGQHMGKVVIEVA